MLITTEARNNVGSHAKDMGETVGRLTAARDEHESLSETAKLNGALESLTQQAAIAAALKRQNDGIKGAVAGADAGGSTSEEKFPELAHPHLVLSSPAGIATTTAQSTHIASDWHTALTTGKNLSIAAGDNLFASIRQTFRLFVHKAGMKLVAAAGNIDMQALSDSINLLAKLNITQTANTITLAAKEEVLIIGGGSYARLNSSGIEHGTNGTYVAHAATRSFVGAKSMDAKILIPSHGGHDADGTFMLAA